MEENEQQQQNELPAPPRFRNTIFKIMTLTLLFLALFFSIGLIGLEATSSSKFCSSCHEMKPEYYTWKASSHGEVDCESCHIEPGVDNLVKAKGNGIVELYKKQTQTYTAPIRMPKDIPDSACEKCHNVFKREVTPSGDIIIPHDKHKNEGIECAQCHSGVAHGKIADRKVTYKSDYSRWTEVQGQRLMAETKYTRPQMDTCMECHEVRKAPLECEACHQTSMFPEDHKTNEFKNGGHGKIETSELPKCERCHSYMSSEKYDLFKESLSYTKYLNDEKADSNNVTVPQYAKTNTFCKDCHGERPKSHKQSHFQMNHGRLAEDKDNCLTCHDNKIASETPVTNVACSSCHPSSHKREWKKSHPVPIRENQKYDATCTQCHVEATCENCHSFNRYREEEL
ncbi:cytochrome C [Bacillus sp. FJAT-27225]|uniref:cytochrome c3 family protein n=1 Tax=Bacillus sp. FJAT-27225 TaxID=1743144 RepID=UPI00080C20CF|nr:NapC/NirT family cytochrome c [Bacillus sp. FJAT-27225]OCA88251.1 cytochrome C [Bacillus sp. FJAT-27225]